MELFGIYLPFTFSVLVVYFINTLIAFIAVILSDNFIAHNIEGKKTFVLALLSFFFAPIIAPYIGMTGIYSELLLPLIIWIAFGELLLEADTKTKLKVLLVAFAVYFVMSLYVSPYLIGIMLSVMPF